MQPKLFHDTVAQFSNWTESTRLPYFSSSRSTLLGGAAATVVALSSFIVEIE